MYLNENTGDRTHIINETYPPQVLLSTSTTVNSPPMETDPHESEEFKMRRNKPVSASG